jgi:hypothetical protein
MVNWMHKISQISEDMRKNIEKFGFEVIECKKINQYNICLAFLNGPDIYQIGISTENLDFTDISHQHQKYKYTGDFDISTISKIGDLIKSWTQNFQPIYIGSMNNNKTKKWLNVLSYLGFDTRIEEMYGLSLVRLN